MKCAPQKIIVLGSSETFPNSEQGPQVHQAACMATNGTKIFSSSSTSGFNTVLKRFSSSKSRPVAKRVLSFPESTRKLSPKLPKFPLTIFIASDNWPTLPSLLAQVQPPTVTIWRKRAVEECHSHRKHHLSVVVKVCRLQISTSRSSLIVHTTKPASPPVSVLHAAVRFKSAAKIDDLSLTAVASSTSSAVLSFDAPLWRLRLVSLSGQGTMGNTFGNQDPERRTTKKAAKTRQPDQQVLVSTFVQQKKTGKQRVAL